MDEMERIRRMAADAGRQIGAIRGLTPTAEQIAAQERMSEVNRSIARRRAEQDAAPLITRDAILELNKTVDELLEATQGLAAAAVAQTDEAVSISRQTKWVVRLSIGILVVSIAALLVALLK